MNITFNQLRLELKRILVQLSFPEEKADGCAGIFAANSRDGVYSHGLNRFPVFVKHVRKGLIDPRKEPQLIQSNGPIENWDGQLAPGMYNASICMDRAISLAKDHGIGCVTLKTYLRAIINR